MLTDFGYVNIESGLFLTVKLLFSSECYTVKIYIAIFLKCVSVSVSGVIALLLIFL
jgi:hypothetical protein